MVTFQAYAVPVPFQGEYAEVLTTGLSRRGSHDVAQASNSDKSVVDSLKVFIRLMISFVV